LQCTLKWSLNVVCEKSICTAPIGITGFWHSPRLRVPFKESRYNCSFYKISKFRLRNFNPFIYKFNIINKGKHFWIGKLYPMVVIGVSNRFQVFNEIYERKMD
jgi:hypothetical protein